MTDPSGFRACLNFTLDEEGGYQAHPADRGNWLDGKLVGTNRGISAPVLAEWLGRDPSAEEMRALDEDAAAAIFAARFWNVVRGGDLPPGIDLLTFDHAVNAGCGASARLLQGVLTRIGTVTVDGFIGPRTVAALQRVTPRALIADLVQAQGRFYRGRDRFPEFGAGWLKRLARRERAALAMLRGNAA